MIPMDEQNVLDDLRSAKKWHAAQFSSIEEMAIRLRQIQADYEARTGEFASVPNQRSETVRAAIESAPSEPGRALLNDTRAARA